MNYLNTINKHSIFKDQIKIKLLNHFETIKLSDQSLIKI